MTVRNDRLRGRCTGLPACCIEFFVTEWPKIYGNQRSARYRKHSIVGVEYVPCSLCIKNKSYVKPRTCRKATCVCGGWAP